MKNCFHQYGHQYCNHHYRKNATEFKVFQLLFFFFFFFFFFLNSITLCDITEYCIVGLKTIYSNIIFFFFFFFLFHLICILTQMVITFEPVGIFSCSFRFCAQENTFCHLSHVVYSALGIL